MDKIFKSILLVKQGMIKMVFLVLLTIPIVGFSQSTSVVSVFDFVRIKNNKSEEALFFYENNWKHYRDIALAKKYISSYRLVSVKPDSVSNFDLILITEYPDNTAFNMSEERFALIIKEARPNGPKLLNELKPNDFREILFSRKAETFFSSN